MMGRPRYLVNFFSSIARFLAGNLDDLADSPPAAKKLLLARIAASQSREWTWELPTPEEVVADTKRVREETGLWPLSFAYPYEAPERETAVERLVSPLLPGHRYRYKDVDDYLHSYRSSAFAMTHKKAGWDCFRHLEILYSGGIPFMPDVNAIPEGTMVHYPKKFFREVVVRLFESGDFPPQELHDELRRYFNHHLTTRSMARYIMDRVGMKDKSRVLFVSESAENQPDYTSNLTFIGLKQILGSAVVPSHPLDYLYSDWGGRQTALYGRGFGYARVLDPNLKADSEREVRTISRPPTAREWDWLVLGSVARDAAWAQHLLDSFSPERTIWLHGEDHPPTPNDIATFRSSGAHVFVREIPTGAHLG